MRKTILLVIGIFLATIHSTYAQLDDVKRIVKDLCSPSFHGRGYVNGGDSIAADYIIQEFQKAGLRGVNGTHQQRFSFPVNTFPGKAQFIQNGKTLKFGHDILMDERSPSFNDTLRYKIIRASTFFTPEKIIGYIQEVLSDESPINSLAIDYKGLHKDSLKLVKNFKFDLAQFVPVIEIVDEKMIWSVGNHQLKNPIFELQRHLADEQPIIVNVDAVLNTKHSARNIFGYLPAAKKTDKTIVVCAHYDHLGRFGQETYFPGANDNASGTAMIIALANKLRQTPQKFNYLFIAFAAEEAGLLGSKHYIENPILPLEHIRFVLNLDILGSGEDGITVVNGTVHPKHFELLKSINSEKNYLKEVKPRGYAAKSDHYWFSDRGIQAFFVYTMGPNKQYHDPFDNYENLSFAEVNDLLSLFSEFLGKLGTTKIKELKIKD